VRESGRRVWLVAVSEDAAVHLCAPGVGFSGRRTRCSIYARSEIGGVFGLMNSTKNCGPAAVHAHCAGRLFEMR